VENRNDDGVRFFFNFSNDAIIITTLND